MKLNILLITIYVMNFGNAASSINPNQISYPKNRIENFGNITETDKVDELRSLIQDMSLNGSVSSEMAQRIPKRVVDKIKELMESKQLPPLPDDPISEISSNIPCSCKEGICGCCTGGILSLFNSKGCAKLKYLPEEFAFDFRLTMNDVTLYKNKVTGKNPRPICIYPPRFQIVQLCAEFHDLYFVGRNMHVCLDMTANFEGYEVFNRRFNCMKFGESGVHVSNKPESHPGVAAGSEAEIDAGTDDIEEYDEVLG